MSSQKQRIKKFMDDPDYSETMVFDPATGKLIVQNKSAAQREQERGADRKVNLEMNKPGAGCFFPAPQSEQEILEQQLSNPDKNRVVVLDEYTGKVKVEDRATAERNQHLPAGRRQVMLGMHDDDGGGFFLVGRHHYYGKKKYQVSLGMNDDDSRLSMISILSTQKA